MKLDGHYAALVMEQQITHGYFHKKQLQTNYGQQQIVALDAKYSLVTVVLSH